MGAVKMIYQRVALEELPLDEQKRAVQDIYAYAPRLKLYAVLVPKGEVWSAEKEQVLLRNADSSPYIGLQEAPKSSSVADSVLSNDPGLLQLKPIDPSERLGFKETQELHDLFKLIKGDGISGSQATEQILKISDGVLGIVAPDVGDLKRKLLNNIQNLAMLDDSSALLSLAILFATCNGFSSKSTLRDLSLAIMLMDLPMMDLSNEERQQYFLERPNWSEPLKAKVYKHPLDAYDMVFAKAMSVPDLVLTLVRNHHELFNGKGFPKGVRSETLPNLVKILSLAVETFEMLRCFEIQGESRTLMEVLMMIRDEKVEPHLRRHSRKVCDDVIKGIRAQ